MITEKIKRSIDKSVLCWLATCNENLEPNVSPKEMFVCQDDNTLLIANIASPNSLKNIKVNQNVCVSFVDIFIQKGYKLKGIAKVISKRDSVFPKKSKIITDKFSDLYPISDILEITITKVDQITAPSYHIFPNSTTEESQIKGAMKTYNVQPRI